MHIHRGKYIKQLIEGSEYSVSGLAKRLNTSRSTMYRWIGDKHLSFVTMLKIADSIGADISFDFPQVGKMSYLEKKNKLIQELDDESTTIEVKYMRLLERHNELLSESFFLKEQLAKYRKLDYPEDWSVEEK